MKAKVLPILWFFGLWVFLPISLFAQLEFVENQGQWESEYRMMAKLNYGDFWVGKNKVAFALSDFGVEKGEKHPHGNPEKAREHHYTMEFVGSRSNARVMGNEKKAVYHNYFIGEQSRWRSDVPVFQVARQQNLYPETDLIWKEEKGNLKYEFELKRAKSAHQIKIKYSGLNQIDLKDGKLVLKTSLGTITEQSPVAFQMVGGKKKMVACRFRKWDYQTIGFEFPQGYLPDENLVIDPVLIFSTFSGSRSDNWGFTATYGENGVTYSGGIVLGTRFPRTPGSYQPNFAGDTTGINYLSTFDIGVLKFNANGSQLIYATYLGGSEAEIPASMVVDGNNNLVILGASSSTNFPTTTGAYDRTFNGGTSETPYGPAASVVRFRQGSDIIISKLSPNGNQLIGSTFLGGVDNDGLLSLTSIGDSPLVRNYGDSFRGEVAVDSLNNIYIASHTRSNNFPTVSPLQATKSGRFDGICARFNPNLTALQFSTFLGGSADDAAFSLQVVNPNLVYVAGGTSSSNFPRTSFGQNQSYFGGTDGYVCRFNPTGGLQSLRSSYLGTSSFEQAYFVQLDRQGRVYMFGQSTGAYPVSDNVYSNPNSSQFIHCMNANLDSTRFSTVFGSGTSLPNISPTAFLVDDCGRIYCSGWGGATNNIAGYVNGNTQNLPTTPGAFSQSTDGSDFYLIALEKDAQALSFATYFGASGEEHVDGGTSRFDKKGVVYQAVCAGCGGSSSFPTTPGVWSNTNLANNCNNAVFKYDFSLLKAQFLPSQTTGCAPVGIQFTSSSTYAAQYQWNFGSSGAPVFTNLDTITHVFDSAGVYQIKLVAINSDACPSRDSIFRTITIQKAPTLQSDSLRFCDFGDTLQFPSLPSGPYTYTWSPTNFLSAANIAQPQIIQPQNSIVYSATVSTSLGCQSQVNMKLSNGILKAGLKADTNQGCVPFSPQFSNLSYQGKDFTWFWGNGDSLQTSGDSAVAYTFTNPGQFQVIIKAVNDSTCLSQAFDTLMITVLPSPSASDTLLRFCGSEPMTLYPGANQGTQISWSPGQLLNDSTLQNPIFLSPQNQIFTYTVVNENQCRNQGLVQVRDGTLKADFTVDIPTVCAPVSLLLDNNSLNAQKSRWFWEGDSVEVEGAGIIPLAITQAGEVSIRLKVLSDTACQNEDQIVKTFVFGGVPELLLQRKEFCVGDSVMLTAFQGPGYQYDWPSFIQVGPMPNEGKLLGTDSIRFNLVMRDTLQCAGSQLFELIPGKPNSDFQVQSLFEKCTDELRYRFESVTPGLDEYQWKIGTVQRDGREVFYTFSQRNEYAVQLLVSRDGCRDSTQKIISVQDTQLQLKASFKAMLKWDNCVDIPVIRIENQSEGANRLVWYLGTDSIVGNPTTITPTKEGDFDLVLRAYQDNCLSTASQSLWIRKMRPPSLITANQDNKNETFHIPDLPAGTSLEIKNRWGKTVFDTNDYDNNWKPDSRNATYFYKLKLPQGSSCNGWIFVTGEP